MSTSWKEEVIKVALFAAIEHGYVEVEDDDEASELYRLTAKGRALLRYVKEKPEWDS